MTGMGSTKLRSSQLLPTTTQELLNLSEKKRPEILPTINGFTTTNQGVTEVCTYLLEYGINASNTYIIRPDFKQHNQGDKKDKAWREISNNDVAIPDASPREK